VDSERSELRLAIGVICNGPVDFVRPQPVLSGGFCRFECRVRAIDSCEEIFMQTRTYLPKSVPMSLLSSLLYLIFNHRVANRRHQWLDVKLQIIEDLPKLRGLRFEVGSLAHKTGVPLTSLGQIGIVQRGNLIPELGCSRCQIITLPKGFFEALARSHCLLATVLGYGAVTIEL